MIPANQRSGKNVLQPFTVNKTFHENENCGIGWRAGPALVGLRGVRRRLVRRVHRGREPPRREDFLVVGWSRAWLLSVRKSGASCLEKDTTPPRLKFKSVHRAPLTL